jgi:hypothetical protein|tara:strand:+ start:1580 stop:2185 length:606 start_codon:yes stop_codon:yes gene_type:complete
MKQALLIGCGNQRGERIVNGCIEAGYSVTNIGSGASTIPTVNNIEIVWKELDIIRLHKILVKIEHKIDFIFFNQNASSLSQENFLESKITLDTWSLIKDWSKSYWLSCQLPYFLIKTLSTNLHSETIIGWMLSSYIDVTKKGVDNHPDYSGNKFTNYLIMKSFAKKFKCFGINPKFEKGDKITMLIKEICLNEKKCNGNFF